MISPNFATMLCFVQTDAALDAETADLLLGVTRQALVRPHLRRRPAVDERHRDPDGERRERRARSRPSRDDELALRRGARRAAAPARAADRRATARAPQRVGRVVVRGGDAEAVERAARAVANSPLVKTALHGGDPNWGRIAQAVGGVLLDRAARRSTSRSRACRCAPTARCCPTTTRGARRRRVAGEEVEYAIGLRGERRRDGGLLLRPLARVRDDQRGLHDVSTTHATARRRHAARGAALHPRVPRQDRRHQVRRRGDDRPGAARGVRARRRAAQVRRAQPDRRARRRPRHHRLHGAARACRSSSSAACASPTRRRSRSRRWCSSARSTRTSCCASTATGSRRSGSAATTGCCSASRARRRRAARTSASSGAIERVDVDVHQPHRAGLHPGRRLGRRRPRGPLVQRQRRRGGRRGRARARRLQGDVPDRRRAAGCATPPTRTA